MCFIRLTCFLTSSLLQIIRQTYDWENELNSTLLDSSAENGVVCANQPSDAASVATGGGATKPCAPSRSTNDTTVGAKTVSREEFNELKLEVNTIALETKNNTSDIQRLEQEVGKRHKWTTEEVRINEISGSLLFLPASLTSF